MPFSHLSQLSPVMGFIERHQPRSVLDVGVGMGQYGFLARTNLEHLNLCELTGSGSRQREKSEWLIRIDGIEGYPEYLTPVHDYAYNKIHIGDALEVLPQLDARYDLVLAIDILEHFEKADGLKFIDMLKEASNRHVLVATPKEFTEQHFEANPYENHRSHWTGEELAANGLTQVLDNPHAWIAVFTRPD